MKHQRSLEIMVGLFVISGLIALSVLATQVSTLGGTIEDGYELNLHFENTGGLKVKSPVMLAGVRVGQVVGVRLNKETYEAVVTVLIDSSLNNLPTDTTAAIFTAGLLGEQYIALEPGGEDAALKVGDDIRLTQSAIVLEQVIGQVLFQKAAGE